MEHDHMIEAFATSGANHPRAIGAMARRARCRPDFPYTHVLHVFSEFIAKNRIAVAQEVARSWAKGNASRSCCPVQPAVGWAVTLKCKMRRRSWAKTRNT